jgi:hypothetical protein
MADGNDWSLPIRSAVCADPEYDELLQVVCEAENRSERLLAELAMTIFLLTRNYNLAPDGLDGLLRFGAGHPGLTSLQQAVHDLGRESMERSRTARAFRTTTPAMARPAEVIASPSPRPRSFGSLGMP